MAQDTDTKQHARLIVVLELGLILLWTLWVGRAYLNMDPSQWPIGREFGMSIQPHYIWTHLLECGPCVLWNGGWNGGSPTLVELHAAVAHPLVVISTILLGGINGAKVTLLGSLFMAGVAQWWLGRAFGFGRVARLWSACLVVSAGHLAGRMEHGTVGLVISTAACSLVLAPALQVARRGRRRDIVLMAVTLALALVSGQGYLQIGLILGILPLYALFFVDNGGQGWSRAGAFVLAIGLALLLAGVFLVPLAHFWPQFGKELDPAFQALQPLAYIPFNFVIADSGYYQSTTLGKQPYGYLYMNYVGWIPVLLALVALRLAPKEKGRLLLFCLLAIAVALLMAGGIPFRWLALVMPGLAAGMRSLPVLAGLATPFLIALAAWGMDELFRLRWPTLAFESSSGARRLRISTVSIFVPLLVLASLLSVYRFSKGWLSTLPQLDMSYEVIDAARTESAQWVAMPYGEHFWSALAAEADLKLTYVVRPAHWRYRDFPPPYVQAERNVVPPGTVRAIIEDIHLTNQAEHPYAQIETPSRITDCQATAVGGAIDVVCDAREEGALVVRENTWSSWKAWRDGQRVPLLGGSQWLSVQAPPGQHTYQFRYRPWDVWLGAALTILGILLAAALWWPGLATRLRRLWPRGSRSTDAIDPPIEAR